MKVIAVRYQSKYGQVGFISIECKALIHHLCWTSIYVLHLIKQMEMIIPKNGIEAQADSQCTKALYRTFELS